MLDFQKFFGESEKNRLKYSNSNCDNPMLYHCLFSNTSKENRGRHSICTRNGLYGTWRMGHFQNQWMKMDEWAQGGNYKQVLPLIFPYYKMVLCEETREFNFNNYSISRGHSSVEPCISLYDFDLSNAGCIRYENVAAKYSAYLTWLFLFVSGKSSPGLDTLMKRTRRPRPDLTDDPSRIGPSKNMLIDSVDKGFRNGPLVKFGALGKTKRTTGVAREDFLHTAKWIIDMVNAVVLDYSYSDYVTIVFKNRYFDLVVHDYPTEDEYGENTDINNMYLDEGMIIYRMEYKDYADLWITYKLETEGRIGLDKIDWLVAYGIARACVSFGIITSGLGYERNFNERQRQENEKFVNSGIDMEKMRRFRSVLGTGACYTISDLTNSDITEYDVSHLQCLCMYTDWCSEKHDYHIDKNIILERNENIYLVGDQGLAGAIIAAQMDPNTSIDLVSIEKFRGLLKRSPAPATASNVARSWAQVINGLPIKFTRQNSFYGIERLPMNKKYISTMVEATKRYDRKEARYRWYQEHDGLAAEAQLGILEVWLKRQDAIVTGETGSGKTDIIPLLFFHFEDMFGGFSVFDSPRQCNNIQKWYILRSDCFVGKKQGNVVLSVPRRNIVENELERYLDILFNARKREHAVNLPIVVDVRYSEAQSIKDRNYRDGEDVGSKRTKLYIAVTDIALEVLAYIEPDQYYKVNKSEDVDSEILLSCLIIDEVHEQQINTIALISIAKQKKRFFRNLILISATVEGDIDEVRKAFPDIREMKLPGGAKYKVAEAFIPNLAPTLPGAEHLAASVYNVVRRYPPSKGAHAIAFLVTQNECTKVSGILRSKLPEYDLREMHAGISQQDREETYKALERKKSVLLLATNYAESSITLKNLEVVYDYGKYYDGDTGEYVVIDESMLGQRKGRVGRVALGRYYGLFSQYIVVPKSESSRKRIVAGLTSPSEKALVPMVKKNSPDKSPIFRLVIYYYRYNIDWRESYMPPRTPGRWIDVENYMKLYRFHPAIPNVPKIYFENSIIIEEFGFNVIPMMNLGTEFSRALPMMLQTNNIHMSASDFMSIKPYCAGYKVRNLEYRMDRIIVREVEQVLLSFVNRVARREMKTWVDYNPVVSNIRRVLTLNDIALATKGDIPTELLRYRHKSIAFFMARERSVNDGVFLDTMEKILQKIDITHVAKEVTIFKSNFLKLKKWKCRMEPASKERASQDDKILLPKKRVVVYLNCDPQRSPILYSPWNKCWLDLHDKTLFTEYESSQKF